MFAFLHTIFYFVIALAILITFHEFGHFIVARKLGVKVIRFSVGFGSVLWRYQKAPETTEFTVCALPLGGYVKMVDEREGEVAPADLPYAFNRQPIISRSLIVAAGPVFNFALAVLLFWAVFMLGETGIRPVLGPVEKGTLAEQAGFKPGEEIVKVGDQETPTWTHAIGELLERVIDEESVPITVKEESGAIQVRTIQVPLAVAEQPDQLQKVLGFRPWEPAIDPIVGKVEPGSVAEQADLRPGDRIVSTDGVAATTWNQWVEVVRAHPGKPMEVLIDRGGVRQTMTIVPASVPNGDTQIGRIGAAAEIPENLLDSIRVEYQLGFVPAFVEAFEKTLDYSTLTLKMMGRMLVGSASIENLSGPISIAQYAGQSARGGLNQFLKFLAIVSVSLAVLNLLPIPVLDGGHLFFYAVEAAKGSPVSLRSQLIFQQVGMFILLGLMGLAFFLDIERLLH